MTVLLLRLAGPMQAWGADSRFARRDTLRYPTKSGVLGLLAAADGRRRSDSLQDLAQLRFGVRVDQPGRVVSDFQTAHNWTGRSPVSMPLSTRFYLSDAVFVAGVEGDRALLQTLEQRLHEPVFVLSLGRRSCPTTGRVALGLREMDLEAALRQEPWQASKWFRRRTASASLRILVDADSLTDGATFELRDVPVSFDPRRRDHGWRRVSERPPLAVGGSDSPPEVDFFAAVGGL